VPALRNQWHGGSIARGAVRQFVRPDFILFHSVEDASAPLLGIRSSFGSTDDVSGWAFAEAISGSRTYIGFRKALKRLTDKFKCQKPDSYFSLAGLPC
jgi:hypothetical protein